MLCAVLGGRAPTCSQVAHIHHPTLTRNLHRLATLQVLTRADPGNAEMLGFWELYHKHLGASPRVAQQHLAKIYAVRGKTPGNHRRLAGLSHELGRWAEHLSNEEKVAFLDRYVVGR